MIGLNGRVNLLLDLNLLGSICRLGVSHDFVESLQAALMAT